LNLPLINTLRADDNSYLAGSSHRDSTKNKGEQTDGEKEEENDIKQRKMETIPNPPSFYEDDMQKWNQKFSKHIKEREIHKKL
tara:strand:- start:246 stop:494 length:249 start_codon:yes stop_codon:yes gene_type:complete